MICTYWQHMRLAREKFGLLLTAYLKMQETMLQRYVFQVRDNNGLCGLSNI